MYFLIFFLFSGPENNWKTSSEKREKNPKWEERVANDGKGIDHHFMRGRSIKKFQEMIKIKFLNRHGKGGGLRFVVISRMLLDYWR